LKSSNVVTLNRSLPVFRAKLDHLAEMTRTLYALCRLAETQPGAFAVYRHPPAGDTIAKELHAEAVSSGWPGRATAQELRSRAETMLHELGQHSVKYGAVLCANTLLENYRIVGGLFVAANRRDPTTFLHQADETLVNHWLNAVRKTQVEHTDVTATLKRRGSSRTVWFATTPQWRTNP
jgi:hypothetical protein